MLCAMRCPSCQADDTKVVDSREAEEGSAIRRRRVCESCGERFTTFERSESARIQVIKRDGSRQEFDRRKLAGAIAKAATEGLTTERIGALIDDLEQTIRQTLPEGFQRSEFLLEHGQVDLVVERRELRETLRRLLAFFAACATHGKP